MKKEAELVKQLTDMAKDTKMGKIKWEVICQTTEYNDVDKKPKTVYLRFSNSNDILIGRITALLRLFPGSIPVHFYYQDTKQQVLVPESMYAEEGEYLKNKLIKVLGDKNVVYK